MVHQSVHKGALWPSTKRVFVFIGSLINRSPIGRSRIGRSHAWTHNSKAVQQILLIFAVILNISMCVCGCLCVCVYVCVCVFCIMILLQLTKAFPCHMLDQYSLPNILAQSPPMSTSPPTL